MSNTALDLSRQVQALSPIRNDIRAICESVGIDTKAAEDFAQKNKLLLPWHESVSPEASLKSAREILKNPPVRGQDAMEVVDHFTQSAVFSDVPIGLIGALAAVGNKFWDAPAKAGFLMHFPPAAYTAFTLPTFESGASYADPNGVRGALCWLVHDVLAAGALQNTPLSKESSEVIDILVKHAVISLVDCARCSARSGGPDFNLIHELDGTLSNVGIYHAETRPRVAQLLKVVTEECNAVDDRDYLEIRLHEELLRLYPDPFLELNLSGVRISKESSVMTAAYRATQALTNFLSEPITSQPEWSNPLGAAADEIKTKELVRLDFKGIDLLTSTKGREVLFDLLSQAPGTTLALPVDLFFTRRPADPSYEDLAADLNHFIEKNVESYLLQRTSQPDFDIRKERTVDFLRTAIDKLGYEKVIVVSPADMEFIDAEDGSHICLITETSGAKVTNTEGKVTIHLYKREPDDDAVVRMQNVLAPIYPEAILAGNIQSAIIASVVPTLAQQDTPRDKHGLNGLWPAAQGLALSNVNIEGVGQFPNLNRKHFALSERGLVIMYTGQHEEPEEELPMDAEDAPREEEDSNTGTMVGSKR